MKHDPSAPMVAVQRCVYFRDDLCLSCSFHWTGCAVERSCKTPLFTCPAYDDRAKRCGCLMSATVSEMEQNVCSLYVPNEDFNRPLADSNGETEKKQ